MAPPPRALFSAVVMLTSIAVPAASFTPSTSFFLACGAFGNVSLPQDFPARTFVPDAPFLSSSRQTSTASSNADRAASSPLYDAARFSSSPFSYRFSLDGSALPAPVILRIHFSSASANFSSQAVRFDVSALGGYLLLSNFSPPAGQATVKEFFLSANSSEFDLSLAPRSDSVALVSAIELFSSPRELLNESNPTVLGGSVGGLAEQVLETMYRLNVGGPLVTPANDTLWRTWATDDAFLFSEVASLTNSTTENIAYDASSGRTPEIAPERVYDTARTMNLSPVPQMNNFNITWQLPVPGGYRYLVRLHFCDFISQTESSVIGVGLQFNVYVMDLMAVPNLTPKDEAPQPAEAFYVDVVTDVIAVSENITVSIGPSAASTTRNAILNGLELWKMNNSAVSLGGETNANNDGKKRPRLAVILAAVLGAVVFSFIALAAVVAVCWCRRRQRKPLPEAKDSGKSSWTSDMPAALRGSTGSKGNSTNSGATAANASPKVNLGLLIPYSEIKIATDNFSERNLLGVGGFGKVYKGVLADGTPVAVKRGTPGSNQGFPEFQTEIVVLSRIRHKHLVSLIGYCDEHLEMILVYEFMSKGTLRGCLYGDTAGEQFLTWKQRLEVCIGAARGLHYLHTGYSDNIIHRDVKSTNILLGDGFIAKVSDFGLSRVGPSYGETHVSTVVKGSFGYLDPEYFKTQKLTDKSDVYSFGVVLFEVLCARPAIDQSRDHREINLAECALRWQRRGEIERIVDPKIAGSVDVNSLRKFGETAAKCLADFGVDRPAMGDVLWNLEYCLQLQENVLSREPYEDSGDVETRIPAAPVRRIAPTSIVADDDQSGEPGAAAEVFSQLISGEGR